MALGLLPACALPHTIIAELHGSVLRMLCHSTGHHCDGLPQAARDLKKRKVLNSNFARKLTQLDCAFAWTRHINSVRAQMFYDDLQLQLQSCGSLPSVSRDIGLSRLGVSLSLSSTIAPASTDSGSSSDSSASRTSVVSLLVGGVGVVDIQGAASPADSVVRASCTDYYIGDSFSTTSTQTVLLTVSDIGSVLIDLQLHQVEDVMNVQHIESKHGSSQLAAANEFEAPGDEDKVELASQDALVDPDMNHLAEVDAPVTMLKQLVDVGFSDAQAASLSAFTAELGASLEEALSKRSDALLRDLERRWLAAES